MQEEGSKLAGVEIGNAWAGRPPAAPTNWVVGQGPSIPADSLRFMVQGGAGGEGRAADLGVKWFVHEPDHPAHWGNSKPTSGGRTFSILAGPGCFELTFGRDGTWYKVILDQPGDFAIWGPGLDHSWRALATSTILTCRWRPL